MQEIPKNDKIASWYSVICPQWHYMPEHHNHWNIGDWWSLGGVINTFGLIDLKGDKRGNEYNELSKKACMRSYPRVKSHDDRIIPALRNRIKITQHIYSNQIETTNV